MPSFNLVVEIWSQASNPLTAPPRLTVEAALLAPRRAAVPFSATGVVTQLPAMSYLLFPARTDVRGLFPNNQRDWALVVSVPGCYWIVWQVYDVARDWPTEFRVGVVANGGTWPSPIP